VTNSTNPKWAEGAGRRQGVGTGTVFEVDFTANELTRQAEVRNALEDDYDELASLEEEESAYRMLFANLDADQQAVYAELVRHGVLPMREGVIDAS
jgi:hypothetical protein